MKPTEFAYHRPGSLSDLLETYAQANDGKILAGGQSLIPLLSMRLARVEELIDINGVEELSYINVDAAGVRFGATTRHSELLEHPDAARVQPLIAAALTNVANATIRNRGTTVGSIVHADAAGEMPMVFSLLGGRMKLESTAGSREVGASELFVGALETCLEPNEIATEVFLPALPPGHGVGFTEMARRHGDYALCAVGAVVDVDTSGKVIGAKTGYVSVSDVPVVVEVTEAFGSGQLTDESVAKAGELALEQVDPESDVHASAQYRAQLVRVLTARALRQAHKDAIYRRNVTSKGE